MSLAAEQTHEWLCAQVQAVLQLLKASGTPASASQPEASPPAAGDAQQQRPQQSQAGSEDHSSGGSQGPSLLDLMGQQQTQLLEAERTFLTDELTLLQVRSCCKRVDSLAGTWQTLVGIHASHCCQQHTQCGSFKACCVYMIHYCLIPTLCAALSCMTSHHCIADLMACHAKLRQGAAECPSILQSCSLPKKVAVYHVGMYLHLRCRHLLLCNAEARTCPLCRRSCRAWTRSAWSPMR